MPEVLGFSENLPPRLSKAQVAMLNEWQPILEQARGQVGRYLQVAVEGNALRTVGKLKKVFAHETRYEIVARIGYIWIKYQ